MAHGCSLSILRSMPTIRLIHDLPSGFQRIVEEMAAGLGELYGAAAEAQYRMSIDEQFAATIRHSEVRTHAAFDAQEVVALCVTHLRSDGAGRITLLHVLSEFADVGIERSLLEEAVALLRAEGAVSITSEVVSFSHLDLDATYSTLGFDSVPRSIMGMEIATLVSKDEEEPVSETLDPSLHGEVAGLLMEAYADHVDRKLHADLQSESECLRLIEGVAAGHYGVVRPEYLRIICEEGGCVAAILGCEVAPDVGFILQVVVSPAARGRGLGERLIREEGAIFSRAGLDRIALGVTDANRALGLYERLGFTRWKGVDAYVWREG